MGPGVAAESRSQAVAHALALTGRLGVWPQRAELLCALRPAGAGSVLVVILL